MRTGDAPPPVRPISVVGGGIAGLVAAITVAESGAPVHLYEARAQLGGRARSGAGEWAANMGPHALCSARTNWTWLEERGILPETAWIGPNASRFYYKGGIHRMPPPPALTGLRLIGKTAPAELSFAAWAQDELGEGASVALSQMAATSFSYHHDPGQLAADFVWQRIRWLLVPPAVHRIVGGWNVLVERLANRARELGVVIECDHAIKELPGPPVIVAVELRDAAELLGADLQWPSGGGLALDVGLKSRRGDPQTILDLDNGALMQSQPPSSAPKGHQLLQIHVGLRPEESPDEAQARVEETLDGAFSGWRQRIAWRRRMIVTGRTGALDYPGTTWRDRPRIEQGNGVFLAGDMVAAEGVLSEVAFNSGQEAGRMALAWASGTPEALGKRGRRP